MDKKKQQHFLSLYKPVHARFERFCRARAYYDMPSEDLINDTLLIAFKKIDQLKNEDAFLSFLIGISTRILANSKRKNKTSAIENELVINNYADPNKQIEQQFEVQFLYRSLTQLPDLQREALILFEITGFSIKEISEIQNSGISADKQRLARGRTALASIVKKELRVKK